MATMGQLAGSGGGTPRPTTLGNSWNSYHDEKFKIREQERFLDDVGLNTKPRVTGAPAVYDFTDRDLAYAKKKLAFTEESLFRQWARSR